MFPQKTQCKKYNFLQLLVKKKRWCHYVKNKQTMFKRKLQKENYNYTHLLKWCLLKMQDSFW